MDEEREFNIEDLPDDELFDGLNDDIPDAGTGSDTEESEEEAAKDEVDVEEDADQHEAEDEDDSDEEEENSSETEDEKDEEQETEQPSDQKFTLKHLDEVREVDRNQVISLAQKGLDYDRIRGERDTLKQKEGRLIEFEAFLKRVAGEQSIEDLIDSTLAKLDVADAEKRGEELDEVEAFKKLRIERVKREARNPYLMQQPEEPEKDDGKERLAASIQRFIKEYPTVKATEVPQEVWRDYRDGRADLVECYQLYENKKLKDEINALKQNQKNKERSTGSKKSAGKKAVDHWFDGWPDD